MPHKAKIADVSALAERLGADEICIGQAAVIDDIRMTAHGAKLHQAAPAEDLRVNALVALETVFSLPDCPDFRIHR